MKEVGTLSLKYIYIKNIRRKIGSSYIVYIGTMLHVLLTTDSILKLSLTLQFSQC